MRANVHGIGIAQVYRTPIRLVVVLSDSIVVHQRGSGLVSPVVVVVVVVLSSGQQNNYLWSVNNIMIRFMCGSSVLFSSSCCCRRRTMSDGTVDWTIERRRRLSTDPCESHSRALCVLGGGPPPPPALRRLENRSCHTSRRAVQMVDASGFGERATGSQALTGALARRSPIN